MTRDEEHRHHRDGDPAAKPLKIMDGVYKGAKLAGMIVVAFMFFATIRERLQAVPVLQEDVRVLKVNSSAQDRRLAYLVGGMEMLTGKHFHERQ